MCAYRKRQQKHAQKHFEFPRPRSAPPAQSLCPPCPAQGPANYGALATSCGWNCRASEELAPQPIRLAAQGWSNRVWVAFCYPVAAVGKLVGLRYAQ